LIVDLTVDRSEDGEIFWLDEELDAAGDAGLPADEPARSRVSTIW
jgi:hypothetical protein